VERIAPETSFRHGHHCSGFGGATDGSDGQTRTGSLDRILATPEDLPRRSHFVVQTLFALLQLMYLGFYVGALANLTEISDIFSSISFANWAFTVMIVTAVLLIPVRTFLLCAVLFRAPGMRSSVSEDSALALTLRCPVVSRSFPAFAPHQLRVGAGVRDALVYSTFAQRSLILMGAGEVTQEISNYIQ
jgi:cholera toxin transcriptional activator